MRRVRGVRRVREAGPLGGFRKCIRANLTDSRAPSCSGRRGAQQRGFDCSQHTCVHHHHPPEEKLGHEFGVKPLKTRSLLWGPADLPPTADRRPPVPGRLVPNRHAPGRQTTRPTDREAAMRMGSWTGRSDLAIVSNGRRGHALEDGPVKWTIVKWTSPRRAAPLPNRAFHHFPEL